MPGTVAELFDNYLALLVKMRKVSHTLARNPAAVKRPNETLARFSKKTAFIARTAGYTSCSNEECVLEDLVI
jgi:hypothetical protein